MSAIARRVYFQPSTDEVVIQSSQDVSAILSLNRALYNASRHTTKLQHSEYVLVGRIPMILMDQWQQMGLKYWLPDDWKIIRGMLNSSEWSGLRTAPGQL